MSTIYGNALILPSGGGTSSEVVSFVVKASGPTAGVPSIWYCSDEGVKQVEAWGKAVSCIKNSMIMSGAGSFNLSASSGIIQIASSAGQYYIYQIIDNAIIYVGY